MMLRLILVPSDQSALSYAPCSASSSLKRATGCFFFVIREGLGGQGGRAGAGTAEKGDALHREIYNVG